ncbi:MAG: rRNA adenine N-6-methyltransferase family protein [bacterium]
MLKPELRQNFTIDSGVLEDVAAALNAVPDDHIVEVGTGKGMLTQKILKIYRSSEAEKKVSDKPFLLGYEVDEDLVDDLDDFKRRNTGIFDYRLQSFIEAKPKKGFNKCTGNIPYHISEPLLFSLIEWDFDHIVFITGIKFARKIMNQIPGKLGTIASILYDSEIVKEYDKNIFYPKSKVDSGLLVMKRKREFGTEKEKLLAEIMANTHMKHLWLNKKLGYDQGQTGQIYHMDLDLLVNTIKSK